MENLFEEYNLKKFVIKKPRKDDDRRELIEKLSNATGWAKKSIHFSTLHFPTSWLHDALQACLHFSDIKARNFKFKEFINETKLNS